MRIAEWVLRKTGDPVVVELSGDLDTVGVAALRDQHPHVPARTLVVDATSIGFCGVAGSPESRVPVQSSNCMSGDYYM